MRSAGERLGPPPLLGHGDGLELEYPVRLVAPPAWLGHTPFALWLVGALRPRVIVELGVHTGNSYCAFLQGVKARKLETRCFGIDHWHGDEHAGLYGDEISEDLRSYHDPLYGSFSTLLRCPFNEALSYFSDGSIDLLHIDGFHTYDAVANDFRSWLPRMSSRGVVLFHDTNVRERDFGIWRFWAEIAPRYPSFELSHSHGLGIAYVGSEPLSGPFDALFADKTDAEIDQIRGYFARLGRSVVERFSLHEVTTKVDAMEAHLAALEAERQGLRSAAQVRALEADLLTARGEAARAKEQASALVAEYDATLRVATLQSQSQTSLLRQHMVITARLQRELLAANQELRAVNQELFAATRQKREHEHTLDQIFRSRSWSVTAPIRFAGAMLRSVLGRGA